MDEKYEIGIAQSVEDPICGIELDPNEVEYSMNFEGTTYYFSSEECKQKFDKNPEEYTRNK